LKTSSGTIDVTFPISVITPYPTYFQFQIGPNPISTGNPAIYQNENVYILSGLNDLPSFDYSIYGTDNTILVSNTTSEAITAIVSPQGANSDGFQLLSTINNNISFTTLPTFTNTPSILADSLVTADNTLLITTNKTPNIPDQISVTIAGTCNISV